MVEKYPWTDNPMVSGISKCDTDVTNDCFMHLKYNMPSRDLERFCFNSGAVDEKGNPTLLEFQQTDSTKIIVLKSPAVYTDGEGSVNNIEEDLLLNITSLLAGRYSIRIDETDNGYILKAISDSKIYKQKETPEEPSEGDLWFNLSVAPYTAYKYENSEWVTTTEVEVGQIEVSETNVLTISNEYNTTFAKQSSGGTSLPLFTPVTMDHVLSFEESMGYALQGTYVYKTGVANERHGYAYFIQKCIDEFNNYTNLSSIKDYINLVGSISLIDGVLSGFNSTSWAVLPQNFSPNNSDWKMFFKFTTGTIGTKQDIINTSSLSYQPLSISINNDGKLYVVTFVDNTDTQRFEITGTTVLSANTTYYVSLEYDSTTGYTLKLGTNKNNMTKEGTSTVTSAINSGYNLVFGADFTFDGAYYNGAFSGSIDLKECYINIANELWWKGSDVLYINANGHMFYNISEKPIIDGWYEQTGAAWFYGVDVENERVFLPRNKWFIQATGDTSKVGQFNPAGLPNITGDTITRASSDNPSGYKGDLTPSGAFTASDTQVSLNGGSYYSIHVYKGSLDASLSSPVYGNSNSVQPASVSQLLYIVVGNTTELTQITTTIPDSAIISQVNKNTTDIIDLKENKISKVDCKAYITETYINGTSGYRVYSDRYCKQWGRISIANLGEATVNLLKTFANTNYIVQVAPLGTFNGSANMEQSIGVLSMTTDSIRLKNSENAKVAMWQAEGYLQEGEPNAD